MTRYWLQDSLEMAQREAIAVHLNRARRVYPPWRNPQFMTAQERLDAIAAWERARREEK